MEPVSIVGAVIGAAVGSMALVGGIASLYFRAHNASNSERLKLLEYRIGTIDTDVKQNYDYCHKETHAVRNDMSHCDARAMSAEREIAERLAVAEYQLKNLPRSGGYPPR